MIRVKRILWLVAVLVGVTAAGAYGFYQAMVHGWIKYNEYDIRSEGLLQVGDLAPDVQLGRVDGDGQVALSELYREKPVVLAFGSYT